MDRRKSRKGVIWWQIFNPSKQLNGILSQGLQFRGRFLTVIALGEGSILVTYFIHSFPKIFVSFLSSTISPSYLFRHFDISPQCRVSRRRKQNWSTHPFPGGAQLPPIKSIPGLTFFKQIILWMTRLC